MLELIIFTTYHFVCCDMTTIWQFFLCIYCMYLDTLRQTSRLYEEWVAAYIIMYQSLSVLSSTILNVHLKRAWNNIDGVPIPLSIISFKFISEIVNEGCKNQPKDDCLMVCMQDFLALWTIYFAKLGLVVCIESIALLSISNHF